MNQQYIDDFGRPPIVVAVLDHDECRVGRSVQYDDALTLWAVMSEDPANWDEVAAYWARYRCPVVCEFVDALPIRVSDRTEALAAINGHGNWIAIDLVQKRIFCGKDVQPLGRVATLAMVTDEKGNQHCPLPFRLPPWWELNESAATETVAMPREREIQIPQTDRLFLFGLPMIEDLAERILQVAREGRLPDEIRGEHGGPSSELHELTVEVHRDSLMTPHVTLAGRCPRDLLHGAHEWSDAIIWGQRMRFEDGAPMTAAPDDVIGFDNAPMGREEMIVYFDLCREVIQAGWLWCAKGIGHTKQELVAFLSDVRDAWMEEPFEGGSPPSFIIECSRRRIPRGSQVPIVGMDGVESEQHMNDCDCPICDMMASGMFGVGFTSLDGHHLELDGEFAFSTHQFVEDWQREQDEYRAFGEEMDRMQAEREARIAAGEGEEDVYASAWSNTMTEGKLPGDPLGHMKLSFRLAEIISDLETADAPNDIIRALNISFREYRESDDEEREASKAALKNNLEEAAKLFPDLVSKVADFQSQVDELGRLPSATPGPHDEDNDLPF
ncbi:hypothetical protein [Stieleria varia]|uniref:Uncharacterized protein n=1 Tax=Stieleria varia TaxID=2528005 RepID=A0A5C6ASD6_9BACT|nr:hypothetical protein [Stieleria varia]TWU02905.1 hypothetical protein Pla52n_39930 [Stieleria varia]